MTQTKEETQIPSPPASPVPNGITFKNQQKLPKLPIPKLADTTDRFLASARPLISNKEFERAKNAVKLFLNEDGPKLQEELQKYASNKSSYIEQFWYDSYLSHSDSVVLNLNPFFVLEDDPTPSRNNQVVRAASLIISSLNFVSALRQETLEPDAFRGIPLCMDQFHRIFATSRIPTESGCKMETDYSSRHIVVMCRSQFYWFDVLNQDNSVAITERQLVQNLKAIKKDATTEPVMEAAKRAIGVLSTEKRHIWAGLRQVLQAGEAINAECLKIVETALFVVCLDDINPQTKGEVANNMLCGSYQIKNGVQIGTCTNRWYDKLQIIVCEGGQCGVNFEHTGVDGHTVLRFVSDIYTDTILRFASSINASTHTLFPKVENRAQNPDSEESDTFIDIAPKRLEWQLTPPITAGIRFAETRLSDLILQNETKVLEFQSYGKNFITAMGFSPDAFVQMAFQAAYYGMYGRVESTYEPAMTKSFLHGRTEAIRTATAESVEFVRKFCSDAPAEAKVEALKVATKKHTAITKDCSKGQGQDRHLYALFCVWQRLHANDKAEIPELFASVAYNKLNTTILSTSNCGNPSLRLFGFGPTAGDGFGLGYIIKDEGIAVCASSKHRQTQRYLDTLQAYLLEVQKMLIVLKRAKDEKDAIAAEKEPHVQVQRASRPIGSQFSHNRTGSASKKKTKDRSHSTSSSNSGKDSGIEIEEDGMMSGYGFFDAGDIVFSDEDDSLDDDDEDDDDDSNPEKEALRAARRRRQVGRRLKLVDY